LIAWDQWYQILEFVIAFDVLTAIVVIYVTWWKKRGKIEVRIETPLGEQRKWLKPDKEDGKTIVVEKPKEGKKIGWQFTFDRSSIIPVISKLTGRAHYKIEVMYGSTKAIEYNFEDKDNPYKLPVWDRKSFEDVVVKEGMKMLPRMVKIQLPTVFWILVLMQFVTIILVIAVSTGLRFG